jgi:putative ABC transport system substrate-binding protein
MQFDQLKRRDFILLLGGAAAAWPLAARAQQPAMPVIGFLGSASPHGFEDRVRAFRQGLKDTGYVEGVDVAIEYRWAENQFDRLPALAAELVRRQVAVIAAASTPSALAAKAATTTIPIVFISGADPIRLGLVSNLARPDGNLTGVVFLGSELTAKRLELLRELLPRANRVAVLVNPANAELAETTLRDVELAAVPWGCKSKSSTPARAVRSMQFSQVLRTSVPTRSSSAPIRFLLAGGFNSPTCRRAILLPRHRLHAKSPRLAA